VTGYLVSDVSGAVAAVEPAIRLDRAVVSATARRRFSSDRMVADYLRLYHRLLS
jgi:hypothetical protein